ncbi:MAG: cobalamin biosynthesis protein [Bacillaceae bacterium]|nr:MAG: cobalamin biosynthesis protein [Bacillaceae bacterium]
MALGSWSVLFIDRKANRCKEGKAVHVVVGGAFNGKRKWVKEHYRLQSGACKWFCGYVNNAKMSEIYETEHFQKITVIEGIEQYIFHLIDQSSDWQKKWEKMIFSWHEWEVKKRGTVIIIANDITKGVVPIDPLERKWRDACGSCLQQLIAKAGRVDMIWYGISERLK